MANAYSAVRKMTPYLQSLDTQDIERTLQVKQKNFSYNTQQVEEAIAQFGSIDLIREEDREYLYNNLKSVISIIDDSDSIDFSKSNVGSEISSYISKAIDTNVLKQAQNTIAIRSYDSNLNKLKEDDPALYTTKNDKDARYVAGYYDYMNGESDKLGAMKYTPFRNVEAEMLETIQTYKDIYPELEVEFPDNLGHTIKKVVSRLEPQEWQMFLKSSLTTQDREQLAINGRASYGYSDEAALGDIERIKKVETDAIDQLIKSKEIERANADPATKAEINKSITVYEAQKTAIGSKYDVAGKTAGQIGGYFLENSMINKYVSSLSRDYLLGMGTDDAYFKQLKVDGESGISGYSNQGVYTKTRTKETGQSLGKVVDNYEENIQSQEREVGADMQRIYEALSPKNKGLIDTLEKDLEAQYIKENGEAPSEYTLHRMTAENAGGIISIEDKIMLGDKLGILTQYKEKEKEAALNASKQLFMNNSSRVFEELNSWGNSKISMYNAKGQKVLFSEYLINNGIKSDPDMATFLSSNSKESNTLKANITLQSIFQENSIEGIFVNEQDEARALVRGLKNAGALIGEDDIDDIFTFELREEVGFNKKTIEVSKEDYIDQVGMNYKGRVRVKNPNSLLGKMYAEDLKNRDKYQDNILTRDRSLSQDNLANKFSEDAYLKEYETQLGIAKAQISGENTIVIGSDGSKTKNTPFYKEIATMAGTTGEVNYMLPLMIDKRPDGSYSVYQVDEYSVTKDGDKEFLTRTNPMTINASEVTQGNMPNFTNYVDTESNSKSIKYLSETSSVKSGLRYADPSSQEESELGKVYDVRTDRGKQLIAMASQDMVVPYLKNLPRLQELNHSPQSSNVYNVVSEIIKNSNRFSIGLDIHGGVKKMNLIMSDKDNKGTKTTVKTIDLGGQDLESEEFKAMYHGSAQIFLTMFLENMISTGWVNQDFEELNKIKNSL